jgi:hypothetical protein
VDLYQPEGGEGIQIEYPVKDQQMLMTIKESLGEIKTQTTILLDTFQSEHTLNAEFYFDNQQVEAQVVAKISLFKRCLKEF